MTKEEAMEMLGIISNDYAIKDIDDKVETLRKVYDPNYAPINVYEVIKFKPNEVKFNAIKECAEYLKSLKEKELRDKELDSFIKGTDIKTAREQGPQESLKDYVKYLKDYYEGIIIKQDATKKQSIDLEAEKEHEVINQYPKVVYDDALKTNQPLEDENSVLSEKIDYNFLNNYVEPSNLVTDEEVADALEDSKDKSLENSEPEKTFNPNEISGAEELVKPETPVKPEEPVENDEEVLDTSSVLDKANAVSDELCYVDKLIAKGIQVTRKFVDSLKLPGYKNKLKQDFGNVIKTPVEYFEQMSEKISNVDVVSESSTKDDLVTDEPKVSTEGPKVSDEMKAVVSQVDNSNLLLNKVKLEKASLFDKDDQITKLQAMADSLKDNEARKNTYENLITKQYNGAADSIKSIREEEAKLDDLHEKIGDNKNSFIGNIFSKFSFGHKEDKIEENTPEYKLYSEHKNYLNKLKELESKAILINDDVSALKAFIQIEEKTPELKQEEDNLMNNSKSL